ncbi:hypothetical protein G6F24_016632 [Rhizopus arrhizus]|nr:hypothetical protein G6F24_016632 [Rhizopus arrhizus]
MLITAGAPIAGEDRARNVGCCEVPAIRLRRNANGRSRSPAPTGSRRSSAACRAVRLRTAPKPPARVERT